MIQPFWCVLRLVQREEDGISVVPIQAALVWVWSHSPETWNPLYCFMPEFRWPCFISAVGPSSNLALMRAVPGSLTVFTGRDMVLSNCVILNGAEWTQPSFILPHAFVCCILVGSFSLWWVLSYSLISLDAKASPIAQPENQEPFSLKWFFPCEFKVRNISVPWCAGVGELNMPEP